MLRRLDRRPFRDRHNSKKIAFTDYFDDAGYASNGGLVDALKLGTDRGRAHDAPMQHVRHVEILHIGECARHLRRDVEPRNGCSDKFEILGILGLGGHLVIDRERKGLAADQFSVSGYALHTSGRNG